MTLPLRLWPRAALTVARTFGFRGAALRAAHEARRAGGRFRAAPRHAPAPGFSVPHPFAVDGAALAGVADRAAAVERAERVVAGEYLAYGGEWRAFPADAAGWLGGGSRGEAGTPWWRVRHLGAGGDVKDLWEPARFAWAYDLARAHLLTGDARYAAAFHERLAHWWASSPPFRSVHWSCGQETAIRAAALLQAEAAFADAPGVEERDRARLTEALAASGERIADAVGYAVSQRNNHGISEAAGLVMLGSRFEGRHPEAHRWLRTGRALLDRLVREQFAPDGWYVQHSFNYQRVALDGCVLAARALGGRGDAALGAEARARLGAALELLAVVMHSPSGEVPNHGANDGAWIHPVSLAPQADFRPTLTAVSAAYGIPLPAGVVPDPEVAAWLGVPAPAPGPPPADVVRAGPSGWAAARVGETHVFLRAGRYASRPGHIDSLHLDVRVGGAPVVVDAGTFAYNAPPPWRNGLAAAAVHNGPLVDGREPGVRGPRFLWYVWPRADLLEARLEDGEAVLVAEVPGVVRRTVRATPAGVSVEDRPLAPGVRQLAVRWLLHPEADPALVRVEGGSDTVAAEEGGVAGWYSPTYGVRLPSRLVEARRRVGPGEAVRTTIGFAGGSETEPAGRESIREPRRNAAR